MQAENGKRQAASSKRQAASSKQKAVSLNQPRKFMVMLTDWVVEMVGDTWRT
jgi:hypothetical protein